MAAKKTQRTPKLKDSKEFQVAAMYIAMVVRSSIEDHRVGRLTRKQMEVLEPVLRNSIYTALYAMNQVEKMPGAKFFVTWNIKHIPENSELPVLNNDYIKIVAQVAEDEKLERKKQRSKHKE